MLLREALSRIGLTTMCLAVRTPGVLDSHFDAQLPRSGNRASTGRTLKKPISTHVSPRGIGPVYARRAMGKVLDSTHGQVLFADQPVDLVKLLGFDHDWAERFRRAIAGGRAAGRA